MTDHMSKTSFFWSLRLQQNVKREAAIEGVSVSEFIRTSLMLRMAWSIAMRAAAAGADPNRAADAAELQRVLERIARELNRE